MQPDERDRLVKVEQIVAGQKRQRQLMARTKANRWDALKTGGLLPTAMAPGLLEP